MSEIYWITRLDLISGWLIGFAVIAALVTIVSIVSYICNRNEYETYGRDADKRWTEFSSKLFKISLPCFFAFCTSSILTPTTNEAMLIYGVGSTIDYVKQNNTLQQIPDKCINALDAWVDSLTEKQRSNEN
jgi:Na+-driven multidrug efflux pump